MSLRTLLRALAGVSPRGCLQPAPCYFACGENLRAFAFAQHDPLLPVSGTEEASRSGSFYLLQTSVHRCTPWSTRLVFTSPVLQGGVVDCTALFRKKSSAATDDSLRCFDNKYVPGKMQSILLQSRQLLATVFVNRNHLRLSSPMQACTLNRIITEGELSCVLNRKRAANGGCPFPILTTKLFTMIVCQ